MPIRHLLKENLTHRLFGSKMSKAWSTKLWHLNARRIVVTAMSERKRDKKEKRKKIKWRKKELSEGKKDRKE